MGEKREKRRRLARVTQGYDVVCVNNHAMEDRHITRGKGQVPTRILTVPPTRTDASPSAPPLCAEHDDMRMPDRQTPTIRQTCSTRLFA